MCLEKLAAYLLEHCVYCVWCRHLWGVCVFTKEAGDAVSKYCRHEGFEMLGPTQDDVPQWIL